VERAAAVEDAEVGGRHHPEVGTVLVPGHRYQPDAAAVVGLGGVGGAACYGAAHYIDGWMPVVAGRATRNRKFLPTAGGRCAARKRDPGQAASCLVRNSGLRREGVMSLDRRPPRRPATYCMDIIGL